METKPIETYTVRRQLSYYQSILNLKLSRSTNICAPSCVPCMKMIASLISSSVAGTETTPRLWLEATTTSSGTSIFLWKRWDAKKYSRMFDRNSRKEVTLEASREVAKPKTMLKPRKVRSNKAQAEVKSLIVIYRCVPEAKGKRMKSQLIVWTSTRRFFTLPGIHRRTSSLSQLPTTSFCSKKTTNIHIYNITYFILSSNLLSRPRVSLFHHFL